LKGWTTNLNGETRRQNTHLTEVVENLEKVFEERDPIEEEFQT
jgi:hypothetical protein